VRKRAAFHLSLFTFPLQCASVGFCGGLKFLIHIATATAASLVQRKIRISDLGDRYDQEGKSEPLQHAGTSKYLIVICNVSWLRCHTASTKIEKPMYGFVDLISGAVKSDNSLPADAASAKLHTDKILDASTEKPTAAGPSRSWRAPSQERCIGSRLSDST